MSENPGGSERGTPPLSPRQPEPRDLGIPGFRILRPLGEGGMGEVYEAEQFAPVRRRVALKVVKRGTESKEVIARFESERQALALMNHPAIARVYDAGVSEWGRPYFAMELVAGVPIIQYCDQVRLGTRQRLDLFIEVCHAVQHAHQKGIIHRDLKPSNVLVTLQDGKAVPKIIDFGVAKATEQRLTERTVFTEFGQLIGTPEYMSPEQAELTALDVDTRTDIYSLGVLLYELLVGSLPFDLRELRQAGFDEIRRRIREEEPPRPSTRLSRSGERSTLVATNRGTDPPTLLRQLRGDLDWITMKALEKDRTRRYETANGFALDLERYLGHQPVRARPPSPLYLARKFGRRHRLAVAAAAIAGLGLLLGALAATLGLLRAQRAEGHARQEAATARQVADFLVELFEVSDPGEARGESVTAREILDRGAERIGSELTDEPEVQARLLRTLGKVYDALGLYEKAVPLLEQSLARREVLLGADHLEVAESLHDLGDLYRKQARYAEAEPLLVRAIEVRERALGPESPELARSLVNLAVLYENHGRYAEAAPLFERALSIQEHAVGAEAVDLAATLQNLAILQAKQARHAEAEGLFRRVLEIQERELGADHPTVGTAYNNLAIAFKLQEKYEEAAPLYQRALEIRQRALGPEHPSVADTLNNLGNLHQERGDLARAEPFYRDALRIYESAHGPGHPAVARTLDNLAQLFVKQRQWREAETTYRRALALRQDALGEDHPEVATNLYNLGTLLYEQRRFAEAEGPLRRSLAVREEVIGLDALPAADSRNAMALLYAALDRDAEALPLFESAFSIRARELRPDQRDFVETLEAYAALLRRLGRSAEAEALPARAAALRQSPIESP